jgi:uncharacterized phage protein (TIGR02218 family)
VRDLSPSFTAHLVGEAASLCRCWRVSRRDGVVLGFTDHDRDLVFDGVTHQAASGLEAAEASRELGFAISGGEVAGALSAASLNEGDLILGVYDGAIVTSWLVNWSDVSQRLLLDQGTIGEVKRSDHGFTAEVRSAAHAYGQEQGRIYSRECAADLGDADCGVALVPVNAQVTATDGRLGATLSGAAMAADGTFTRGLITFTSGGNAGFASEIKLHRNTGGQVDIQLWQPAPKPIVAGVGVTLTQGCDKRFTTCVSRFGNGARFRGFPHMPGNDFVLGTVKSGQAGLDGGSLLR